MACMALMVWLAASAAGAIAAPVYSDQVCPEAAAPVIALQGLTTGSPPQKIYEAAKAAASAFDTCGKQKLGNQDIEPGAHYAFTREAQFGVLEARALIALGRADDAVAELRHDRALAADVADWQAALHGVDPGVSVPSDSRYSRFRASAQAVVEAADAELKRLASPAPSPRP
jgi:hypothetical protein